MNAQAVHVDRVRAIAHATLMRLFESMRARSEPTEPDEFFPVRLEKIVQLLGWDLEVVSGLGTVGAERYEQLGRCAPAERKIYLAKDVASGAPELRFTLAHELGHVALGHAVAPCGNAKQQRAFRVRAARRADLLGNEAGRVETQADRFAAELLMPERAVGRQFAALFGRPTVWIGSSIASQVLPPSLAKRQDVRLDEAAGSFAKYRKQAGDRTLMEFFGVSASAMSRRLIELGLIYG